MLSSIHISIEEARKAWLCGPTKECLSNFQQRNVVHIQDSWTVRSGNGRNEMGLACSTYLLIDSLFSPLFYVVVVVKKEKSI